MTPWAKEAAEQKRINQLHLMHPMPGDYWAERLTCPILRVLMVEGERVCVQDLVGRGGTTITDNDPKPRIMSKRSFARHLSYGSIEGTWADVNPGRLPMKGKAA